MFNLNEKEISFVVGSGECICHTKNGRYKYEIIYMDSGDKKDAKRRIACSNACCHQFFALGWEWKTRGKSEIHDCSLEEKVDGNGFADDFIVIN